MTSLSRWDPFREVTTLRDAMDQLIEQAVMRPGHVQSLGNLGAGLGHMNVVEANGQYLCQVILPGVNPTDIDVTVRQNTLTIKATMPELLTEDLRKNATYLLREFGAGEITRSLSLPKDVNGEAVEAQFDRGVLTLAIPIAEHAQAKRVAIREAQGTAQLPFVEQSPDTGTSRAKPSTAH